MSRRPDPASNICHIELDLPWDVAQALVPHLQRLLDQLTAGTSGRQVIDQHEDQDRDAFRVAAAETKAKWAALATECEIEIARRSNGPGQRQVIIKQLAAERKMSRQDLEIILKVNRRQIRTMEVSRKPEHRASEIRRLRLEGRRPDDIAELLGVSVRQVRKHIQGDTRVGSDLHTEASS